jgi:hypothetical protein
MRASVRSMIALLRILFLLSAAFSAGRIHAATAGLAVQHVKSIPCQDPVTGFAFSPLGLSFGLLGELYVVDSDNSKIFILPESLRSIHVFAESPIELPDCQFIDLERNEAGGLYVSERSYGVVLALDRWGELASQCEAGEGIAGIGVGRAGQVYAAMSLAGKIQIVDFNTQVDAIESLISDEGENSYPVDCVVTKGDQVLVTDASSGKVLVLNLMGNVGGRLEGFSFESPFGLAVSKEKYVLVSDMELGVIAVFDMGGKFVGSFGDGVLGAPVFLDARDDGTVCVADAEMMTIEVFKLAKPSVE